MPPNVALPHSAFLDGHSRLKGPAARCRCTAALRVREATEGMAGLRGLPYSQHRQVTPSTVPLSVTCDELRPFCAGVHSEPAVEAAVRQVRKPVRRLWQEDQGPRLLALGGMTMTLIAWQHINESCPLGSPYQSATAEALMMGWADRQAADWVCGEELCVRPSAFRSSASASMNSSAEQV